MSINSTTLNPFSQALAMQSMQAVNPTKAVSGQTTAETAGVLASSGNPFSSDSDYGVGLVNSDLSNMSYTLPSGKQSTCNTLCVA
jgi:hypothetical protein